MSGSYPTAQTFSRLAISPVDPTLVSVAHSMKRQVRKRAGQVWLIEGSYPPLTRTAWAPIFAFLVAQRGMFETFTIVLPRLGTGQGTWTGNSPVPAAVSGASAGDTSIAVDGLTVLGADVAVAGDFFKFTGHSKVYMVTANQNADSSGQITLAFYPELLFDVAASEVLIVSDVPFTVSMVDDRIDSSIDVDNNYYMQVSFAEVL